MNVLDIPAAFLLEIAADLPLLGSTRLRGTTWDRGLTLNDAPLAPPYDDAADLLRVGGLLLAGSNPFQLFARTAEHDWTKLPVHAEDAGPFVLALEGEVDVTPTAMAVAALLGHSVLETEQQVLRLCDGVLSDIKTAAPGLIAERWRAPYLDGDELVLVTATAPSYEQPNDVFEVRAHLREGWVEIERVGDGWVAQPLPPPPNLFRDPDILENEMPDPLERTWNPVMDPRARYPIAEETPGPDVGPVGTSTGPSGLLARLRRFLGRDE